MILEFLDEAMGAGARLSRACEVLDLNPRTVQRWRKRGGGEDRRQGPRSMPKNAFSPGERAQLLDALNRPELRDKSPKQAIPILADQGIYLGSEATAYRILRAADQLHHRERSKAPTQRHRPDPHTAYGPNELWSWDITYLRSQLRGSFFYLYMILDVWSRKIVGSEVHEEESSLLAAQLMEKTCAAEGVEPGLLCLHSDNGSPMKGATMLVKLQDLGVAASFSRPSVSNDNPYSESLFRTAKYRPEYPSQPFESLDAARAWVADFVRWYNTEHLHSAIRFVTPDDRHSGRDKAILEARKTVYAEAKSRHPERWTGQTRNWEHPESVSLNPTPAEEARISD